MRSNGGRDGRRGARGRRGDGDIRNRGRGRVGGGGSLDDGRRRRRRSDDEDDYHCDDDERADGAASRSPFCWVSGIGRKDLSIFDW